MSEEYEEAVQEMSQLNYGKDKAKARELMNATRPNRRQWISDERPTTLDVVEKFPLLHEKNVVSFIITIIFPAIIIMITYYSIGGSSANWLGYGTMDEHFVSGTFGWAKLFKWPDWSQPQGHS